MDVESGPSFSNVRNQVIAALIACYVILSHGANIGFLSPALPVLLSNNTPLVSGPLTNTELSWIGSVSSIGSLFGSVITGLLCMLYGSRKATAFLAFPVITFWVFIHFGTHFYHILIGRLITGLSGGGFQSGVVLFIAEVSNDNIRGRLGSLVYLARNIGVLIAYTGGALIKYEDRPYFFILFPVSFLLMVYFLPDTPQYFLKKNNFEQAEKSLKFYKTCAGKTEQEKTLLKAEFQRLKLMEEEKKNSPKLQWSDFCNWLTFKGILTCIAIWWFTQATGCIVLMNYASLVFDISGSIFSVDVSSIILSIIQIVGGLTSTQLGDAFGRKTILFMSLLGSAFGLFVFSAYLYLHHLGYPLASYMWLPVVCLSWIMFISSGGILALGNTCVVENFVTKIRPAGIVFSSVVNNLIIFSAAKSFPILLEIIYLHGITLLLAVNCCFGLVFVMFMKETNGKSLDTIDLTQNK